jgi:hypothetical protein
MVTSDLSPKLTKDLEDASLMVGAIKWEELCPMGACIPIAYALSEFLTLRGRPSRVAETTLEGRDFLNARWFEIKPADTWMGHVVTLMPTHGLLLDGSWKTQESKVLANFDLPDLIIVPWNRQLGGSGKFGRLTVRYKPDLRANGWRRRDWPWAEIRDVVAKVDGELRKVVR